MSVLCIYVVYILYVGSPSPPTQTIVSMLMMKQSCAPDSICARACARVLFDYNNALHLCYTTSHPLLYMHIHTHNEENVDIVSYFLLYLFWPSNGIYAQNARMGGGGGGGLNFARRAFHLEIFSTTNFIYKRICIYMKVVKLLERVPMCVCFLSLWLFRASFNSKSEFNGAR